MTVRHVAALSNFDLPGYTAVDARFGWQLRKNLELSVGGKNLFGSGHGEYGPPEYRSMIPSGVFARLAWRE